MFADERDSRLGLWIRFEQKQRRHGRVGRGGADMPLRVFVFGLRERTILPTDCGTQTVLGRGEWERGVMCLPRPSSSLPSNTSHLPASPAISPDVARYTEQAQSQPQGNPHGPSQARRICRIVGLRYHVRNKFHPFVVVDDSM